MICEKSYSIHDFIENKDVTTEFLEAQKVWKDHSGGVWEIDINDIVNISLNE
jgi:hypothetical protein